MSACGKHGLKTLMHLNMIRNFFAAYIYYKYYDDRSTAKKTPSDIVLSYFSNTKLLFDYEWMMVYSPCFKTRLKNRMYYRKYWMMTARTV